MYHNISTLYFAYRPVAGHMPSCSRAGTDIWEAADFRHENFDGETTEYTFRFACFECGSVAFFRFGTGPDTIEGTSAVNIGFGSAPERVLGVWLHPGPRFWHADDRGPAAFYVTLGKDRPRVPADVVGVVGWHLGKRGGVRWSAGLGCTSHGGVETISEQDFGSRRAAVAWITAQPGQPAVAAGREVPGGAR
jgi:hypothetical protein